MKKATLAVAFLWVKPNQSDIHSFGHQAVRRASSFNRVSSRSLGRWYLGVDLSL